MKQRPFKSGWFWEALNGEKFEFSKFFKYPQKYFDWERLWYSNLSLLKLLAVKLAVSFKQFLKSFRSEILVKKYEIMRIFNIFYENGWFFHEIFGKSSWKSSKWTNEKLKTSVLDGPLHQIQKFFKLHFCYDSKNLHISIYIQVSNFLNLAQICRENAFPCNFHKIFKRTSFHCQKFLDLKSL